MSIIKLVPISGMNNVDKDDALQRGGDSPSLAVRDAVNIDISPTGLPTMREQVQLVSDLPLKNLWHSKLHSDTFATLEDQWVVVDVSTWDAEPLAVVGEGDISHLVLNNTVLVAGPAGIYSYNGTTAHRFVIENPPAPFVLADAGALVGGAYGVAVSWLRGATESAPSPMTQVEVSANGALEISFPTCFDTTVTHVRLYLTKPNGGELARAGDYTIGTNSVSIPLLPQLGSQPQFLYCDPMPSGRFLSYWRGRLLTAKRNVLNYSEALAYHVHDSRHGFIQFPQRITFVMPVDGGIWVGQLDHVVFVAGTSPENLEIQRKSARAPVPGSAIYLDADAAGQYDQGGSSTVVWLADNGYVAGTAGGQLIENTAGMLKGIAAQVGTSVVLGDRLMTVVT